MKKTIIATAVSAAFMAPVAAQAETTVYGFVHNMISITSSGSDASKTDLSTRGSRFGFTASSDLGNGLTASVHQQFGVATDRQHGTTETALAGKHGTIDDHKHGDSGGGVQTRIGTVGVSGSFGSVNIGRQWGTFYNTVGVYMDPTSTVAIGGYGGGYQNSNTIQYTNTFGPVSVSLEARLDDAGDGQGNGNAAGVSVAAHPNVTFAAAVDTVDNDSPANDIKKAGLGVQVRMGDYYASYAMHDVDTGVAGDTDTDYSVFLIGGSFGATNAFIGVGNTESVNNADSSDDVDSDTVTLHIDHNLGGGLKLLYEGRTTDGNKENKEGDWTQHVLGLKLAF